MSVKITYFVHGTTTDNLQDLATGWEQGELSEKGITQSIELANLVSHLNFDVIICSDLKRAIDSANYAFKNKYPIIQDKRIREANYGDFTLKPSKEFKDRLVEYIDKPFPNGESYKDVEKRMLDFINYLKKEYDGKHIGIVAHQAPQLALDVLLNKKTWKEAIEEDWRLSKAWRPGWEYSIE
ncbi:MAG: histidine phosphatase family protein [archaeon]